jgi:hypothetical protein
MAPAEGTMKRLAGGKAAAPRESGADADEP